LINNLGRIFLVEFSHFDLRDKVKNVKYIWTVGEYTHQLLDMNYSEYSFKLHI